MLKNNKGFTVIELIMSFLFSSILALSLFSVILTYRNKQVDSSIESRLLAFKSQLIMDIQKDIQLKGIKEINLCEPNDKDRELGLTTHPRCVEIKYNGDPEVIKEFKIMSDPRVDVIENENGPDEEFSYSIPYIVYGDIRYDIPDAASVFIDDDYILETSSVYDGLETGTKLYKINFNLKHSDLDTDINVSIVANGTVKVNAGEGSYDLYNIGDRVAVQVNEKYQKSFRVIQNSSKLKDDVMLLYDPEPEKDSSCNVLNDGYIIPKRNSNPEEDPELIDLRSTEFNATGNYANKYDGSIIKTKIHDLEVAWNNADEIRLITTEDIARIASFCPQYRGLDAPDVSLSSTPSWVTNKSYWTMSSKMASGNDAGKKVWYVNSTNNSLSSDYVDENHVLRPVITIKKSYITFKYTSDDDAINCGANQSGAGTEPEISNNSTSNIVCKPATTLHTTICNQTGGNGCASTVGNGNTITYGTLVNGNPKSGDAFDCKVTKDGDYTERFYFVKNIGVSSIFVYYKSINDQASYAYDSSNENNHGPRTAYQYLPSTTEWDNPNLISPGTRNIVAENGATSTADGTIEAFEYTNKAARFLTTQEIVSACGNGTIGNTGYLNDCSWLLENLGYFENSSGTRSYGYWLETPNSTYSNDVETVRGSGRAIGTVDANSSSSTGVRPVIEVLNSSIDFTPVPPPPVIVYPTGKTKETVVTGDIVTIDTEEFYVVKHSGSDLVLLSRYDLNVGSNRKFDAPEGRQDSEVKGWVASGHKYGNVSFASSNYWSGLVGTSYSGTYCNSVVYAPGTICAYVYDANSYLKTYVDNYKTYLEGRGARIKSARLLRIEEALDLGCGQSGWNCNYAPAFVTETSYWLGSAVNANSIWLISSRTDNDNIGYAGPTGSSTYGVRPVIII